MTRELVYTGFMTVDGGVDSPGSVIEGHPNGGWVFQTPFLPEAYSLKGDELAETTALMFGRNSYDAFSRIWPMSEGHAAYRNLPKYVVSTTLNDEALVEGWGEQTILRSLDDVRRLKESEGGAIFIHGSAGLARSLREAGLIDRYNLLMFPFLLTGVRASSGATSRAALTCVCASQPRTTTVSSRWSTTSSAELEPVRQRTAGPHHAMLPR